jgi:hypothetical protein
VGSLFLFWAAGLLAFFLVLFMFRPFEIFSFGPLFVVSERPHLAFFQILLLRVSLFFLLPEHDLEALRGGASNRFLEVWFEYACVSGFSFSGKTSSTLLQVHHEPTCL